MTQEALKEPPTVAATIFEQPVQVAIGKEIRAIRKSRGFTVTDLSAATQLAIGTISKIENGVTSPSLVTLQTIAKALSIPMATFFRGLDEEKEVVLTKAGQGEGLARAGTPAGHHYQLLGALANTTTDMVVEPCLITLTEDSDVFATFQHEGVEMIYMLEGVVDYQHGTQAFRLEPGDTLFFDADAPHGPSALVSLPARYLSILCLPRK